MLPLLGILFAAPATLVEGNASSPVRVVIYEDLQCSDCAAFRKMLENKAPAVAVMTSRVDPKMAERLGAFYGSRGVVVSGLARSGAWVTELVSTRCQFCTWTV